VSNLLDAAYRAEPGVSATALLRLAKSPAHYKWATEHPGPSTPAQLLGTAVHAAVLEPESFSAQFRVADTDGRTKAGKEQREAAAAAGVTLFSTDDYADVLGMAGAVLTHPIAGKLIDGARTEVILRWKDMATEVLCKGRADAVATLDGKPAVVDLKTTGDASPQATARSLGSFGYHIQLAHYRDGVMRQFDLPDRPPCFLVAIEREPPYPVAVYLLDEYTLTAAHTERVRLLALWRRCTERNEWPAYADDAVLPLSLPAWAR
jgi:exodeoxyribonuclease VIII